MADKFFPKNLIQNIDISDFDLETLDLKKDKNNKTVIVLFYTTNKTSKYTCSLFEECLSDVSNIFFSTCNIEKNTKILESLKLLGQKPNHPLSSLPEIDLESLPLIINYKNKKISSIYTGTISISGLTNSILSFSNFSEI